MSFQTEERSPRTQCLPRVVDLVNLNSAFLVCVFGSGFFPSLSAFNYLLASSKPLVSKSFNITGVSWLKSWSLFVPTVQAL